MVKQRFSTADCAAEIGCLKQRVLGFRLANIYDINPKARFSFEQSNKKRSHSTLCTVWPDVKRVVELSFNQCHRVQTYLLKLARSGDDGEKVFLVLESGTRFHTTQVLPLYKDCRSSANTQMHSQMIIFGGI